LKLIKDYLIKSEAETRKSRDLFMRTLHDLGKIIDRK
jgi:hypothetical protein